MSNLLTWRRALLGVLFCIAVPALAPTRLADFVVLLGVIAAAVACFWAARRRTGSRTWLLLWGSGEATATLISTSRLIDRDFDIYLLIVGFALTTIAFFAALVIQLRARRPDGYLDGLFDAFAAFAGLAVVMCQVAAFAPGATVWSVAGQVMPFSGLFVLMAIFGMVRELLRDARQNWRVQMAYAFSAVAILTSCIVSKGWSTTDYGDVVVATTLLHVWLLSAAVLHRDFDVQFALDQNAPTGTFLRWLGPASALATTPVMLGIFVLNAKVPNIWVGVACTALTGVALWRGARLLSERDRGRRELKAELKFRALVEHSSDVIMILDDAREVTFVSGGVSDLFGLDAKVAQGRPLSDFLSEVDFDELATMMNDEMAPGESRELNRDLGLLRHDGSHRWVAVHLTNHVATAAIRGWVLNIRDVTDRKTAEEALSQIALHDSLTGLPNRVQMRDRLEVAIIGAPGRTALLFCDLDGFKAVNDILGHEMGDEVLRKVAGRWSTQLRAADVLGRWGGDEFLVICPDVSSVDQATAIAERLLAALGAPLELTQGHAQLGCSVGVALHDGTESVEALIGRADGAMYAAKRLEGGLRLA